MYLLPHMTRAIVCIMFVQLRCVHGVQLRCVHRAHEPARY
jgi:hypothetical protein